MNPTLWLPLLVGLLFLGGVGVGWALRAFRAEADIDAVIRIERGWQYDRRDNPNPEDQGA